LLDKSPGCSGGDTHSVFFCLALRGDIHFEHIIFKKVLTTEAGNWLTRMITKDEVANTVKRADPDKAPGPDGFSAGFFQKFQSIVHEDVWLALRNFFRSGKMMKGLNQTLISIIPETKTADRMENLRPISLCNFV